MLTVLYVEASPSSTFSRTLRIDFRNGLSDAICLARSLDSSELRLACLARRQIIDFGYDVLAADKS